VGTFFHKRAARLVALLIAGCMVLAACSSDDGDTQSQGSSTSADGSGGIDRSGTLRVGQDIQQVGGSVPFSLDPSLGISPNDPIYYLIYGRLMRTLADGSLEPDLAVSATITGPSAIEVVLRDGLTWQDGAPFDATSVKAGLEYTALKSASERNNSVAADYFALTSVDVVNPTTVRLNIANGAAAGWYDKFIGSWETTIVRPGSDFDAPVGAGPFRLTDYEAGSHIDLERWDGFWNADAVNFAAVEFLQVSVTAPEAGINALKAGQLDVTATVVAQLPAVTGQYKVSTLQTGGQMNYAMVCKNKAPLDDARLRKAINKAIDREAVNDAVYAGTGTPATLIFPEGHRFYSEDVADELAYDPDEAKSLLAEAGVPNGFEFDMYVNNILGIPEVAEVVEQQLAKVGITSNLISAPDFVGQFLGPQPSGAGMVPGFGGEQAVNNFSGQTLANACFYEDPEIDAAVAKISAVSASSPEAAQLWDQINTIYARDALNIPIMFPATLGAYNSETLVIGDVWRTTAPGVFVPDIYTSHALTD
jgi:peptide/nickel transport system substrate-binding protein